MTTTSKNNASVFLSGSTIEGGAYARHLAQQIVQDLDFMLVEGIITSEKYLRKLDAKGFVQVEYDDGKSVQHLATIPLSIKQNQDGIKCINGFKMKEKYCGAESVPFLTTSAITTSGTTTVNSASTEIKYKSISTGTSFAQQFEYVLNSIRRMKVQDNFEPIQSKYKQVCEKLKLSIAERAIPLVGQRLNATGVNLLTFQDMISLTFPMCNIHMPEVNKVRLKAILEFYEKYKRLGGPSILEDHLEYGQLCMENDSDFVPALELDFWPEDMNLFFDRIQQNRPELYKMIYETSSMHLIPKWSKKTSEIDQEIEFRYSFSAIERLLATNRKRAEQILNGVARSIYYKYLKNEPSLKENDKCIVPSYFIKTTVLWMCETIINLNDQFTNKDDDQIIALIMGEKWLEFVKPLLQNGICKHYFIDGMNILESCSRESIDKVIDILEHRVNLDDDTRIEVLIEQDKFIKEKQQKTEDWLGNMKIKDILDAVEEFRKLKENWLNISTTVEDEGDVNECIYTLNQLRTLDGNNEQNWSIFQRLFLNADETDWPSSIWGEEVADYSISEFFNIIQLKFG